MPLVTCIELSLSRESLKTGPAPLKTVSYPERTANTWMMRQVLKLPQQAGPGFLNRGTMDPNVQECWGVPEKAQR